MLKQRRSMVLGLGLAAVLAACSSGGGATTAPPAATTAAPAATTAAPAADATIALAESSLGSIIVDAAGKSLYLFTPDSAGDPTCYDDCAATWPPLLATGAVVAGTGLDASKLTTVDRTDGTKQVKYGDWPLYYFAADAAAGDVKGQAIGEKWYVVDAAGAAIK